MKRQRHILTLLAAIAGILLHAGVNKTIEKPDYSMSSLKFNIEEIALSDTATRVKTFIVNRRGYWVKADSADFIIKGEVSGREYPISGIEGLKFGEKTFIGDSGYISATFIFPPIAEADTVVSFIEKDGAWYARHVDLTGRKAPVHTHISGKVEGYLDIPVMGLIESCDDARVNKTILLPVRNGEFSYDLYTADTVAYEIFPIQDMLLNGAWRNVLLFSEGTPVTVEIEEGSKDNIRLIGGGALTVQSQANRDYLNAYINSSGVNQLADSLQKSRRLYSEEVYSLMDVNAGDAPDSAKQAARERLNELFSDNDIYSPEGKEYERRSKALGDSLEAIRLRRVRDNKSLNGLYEIYKAMKYVSGNLDNYLTAYAECYKDLYPGHPYTKALQMMLGDEAALPGYKVPDFTAPDLEGKEYTLSSLIEGKVALVDLWASWCGPCRRNSSSMIPVYRKWAPKGFTVVGVAREQADTEAMKQAIDRDGYPWLNLVELNDAGKIWQRYRAGNAGGKTVLVDADGKVIAVNPTPEEVEATLQKILGD